MPTIYMRKATAQDSSAIESLIESAKQVLAADNIPQWQGKYPDRNVIDTDIEQGTAYVLMVDHQVAGTATLLKTPDPDYTQLHEGQWQPSDDRYATIHRLAISSDFKGQRLGKIFLSTLVSEAYRSGLREVRIDTHQENKRMDHVATSFGFTYSGVIYVNGQQDDTRNVYQLFLD